MIIEIGNALGKAQYRAAAVELLGALEEDPRVEIVPLSEELFAEGAELYRRHRDKEWGMTDCLSFAVMRRRGLTEALTADAHFIQAGFRALLREDGAQ